MTNASVMPMGSLAYITSDDASGSPLTAQGSMCSGEQIYLQSGSGTLCRLSRFRAWSGLDAVVISERRISCHEKEYESRRGIWLDPRFLLQLEVNI